MESLFLSLFQAITGNRVSKRSIILGSQNIILGGKCIIHHAALVRGDLKRSATTTTASTSSSTSTQPNNPPSAVVITMGRYCVVGEGSVIRPAYKTYKGSVERREREQRWTRENNTLDRDAEAYPQSFFLLLLATFESDLGATCESDPSHEWIQESNHPKSDLDFPIFSLSFSSILPFHQRLLLLPSQDGGSRTRRSRYHSRGNHGRKPCRDWKELRHREFFCSRKISHPSFSSHKDNLTLFLTFLKHRVDSQSSRTALGYWMVQSCLQTLSFIAGPSGVDLRVSFFIWFSSD